VKCFNVTKRPDYHAVQDRSSTPWRKGAASAPSGARGCGRMLKTRASRHRPIARDTLSSISPPSFGAGKLRWMEPSIYEFPDIFRRVHMERPGEIDEEVLFLRQVWRRHYARPVRRLIDIASGDSPHGQIFARDGIEAVGVDESTAMIAAGRRQSRWIRASGFDRCKVQSRIMGGIRFYRRKIDRFKLPERPFDAAIFMCETFPVIRTNAALMSHLKSVAATLKHRGLYCIDVDRHDGVELVRRRRPWRERKVKIGPVGVDVREFYRPIEWHDAMHSIYELECTIHFPEGKVVTRDLIPVRYTTPPLMELIARASGCFELIACYPDLSFARPIENCNGRWLAVLRRT
jgi:SAM-dependent methyltransferase